MFVNFNILNQLGSPAINSNTFANRPAAGQTGRLFVSTDTFEIYRDNGTTWDLIGGPGSSTITGTGTATQVAYFTSSQAIGSSANLYWDNTSGFLGVGTAAPTTRIEAVKTDGIGIYSNYTTNAGSGSSATAIWAKNVTNSSGYGAVIEETTPNATAGQYPLLIKHSLSSGTAGVGMGTGVHWQLPDDAGTFKTTQLTVETINAAAATYATRYRFNVQSNGSSTPVAYLNATGLGIFTATPGAALDIHSTGTIAQFNTTAATGNVFLAIQRSGTGLWRIGDTYNGGSNFFELHNTTLASNAIQVQASSNEATFSSTKTYSTGNSIGVAVQHNLTIPNAVNVGLAALGGINSNLNLTLGGSTTVANTGRQGLEGSTSIRFTGAGTLTMTQASTIRAFSAISSVYSFNSTAVGTITHLAGLRICFPDNVGSAVNITNNYALLINNQTTGTGTVTYTNRWGIYQEGASDLNYMAANLLLGSTVNTGDKLQVTGTASISSQLTVGINTLYVDTVLNRVGIVTTIPRGTFDVRTAIDRGVTFTGTVSNESIISGMQGDVSDRLRNLRIAARNLFFNTGDGTDSTGTQKMHLDESGNLGLGLTPAAWENSTALQVDNQYAFTKYGITRNAVYNAGYKYITNGFANSFEMNGGGYQWFTAVSGTAGNAITFTQPMTLTSGGNLLIGTTTDIGARLSVKGGIIDFNGDTRYGVSRIYNSSTGDMFGLEQVSNVQTGSNAATRLFTSAVGSADLVLGKYTNATSFTSFLTLSNAGNALFAGSIKTAAPTTGTAAEWKLGSRVAATVVVNTTEYIEVDIGGTLYKLATVT